MHLNHKFYLILLAGSGGATCTETVLEHADLTETAATIADNYFPREIEAVVFIDLEAGTNRDASREVAEAASRLSFAKRDELTVQGERFLDRLGVGYYQQEPARPSDPDPDHKRDLAAQAEVEPIDVPIAVAA
jgi:hypothetical protein